MNKVSKSLIVLFFTLLIGSGIFISPARAGNGLALDVVSDKECDIEYSGDSCTVKLKMTNTTGEVLDGEAFLSIDYNNNPFDGKGITARFLINEEENFTFSEWEKGTSTISGFYIEKNETYPGLEINTAPNLCHGEYTHTLTIKGTSKRGDEYKVSVGGGGGGGYYYYLPIATTTDTGEFTATPGEGGMTTLSNPDGSEIKLIIPTGTVPENTDFTVKRADIDLITPPTSEKGFFMVNGLVYEIKAERNAETVTSFSESLTLTIIYPEDQIGNLDENSFQISWWNGAEWIVIENSEVNVEENTVTASINHLTLFALTGYETGFIEEEEETSPEEISEENVEGNISGTERGTEESETEELTAEPELIGELAEGIIGEPKLPPKSSAALLTAATILTLGSGSNVVSIVISFLILGVFAFLYDKFLRKPEKKRF